MKMHAILGLGAVGALALGTAANAAIVITNDGAVATGNAVTYSPSATITGQGTPNSAEGLGNGAVAGGTLAIVGSGTTFTVPVGASVSLTNFQLGVSAIVAAQSYQLNLYALTNDPNTFPQATTGSNLLGQAVTTIPANSGAGELVGFALSGADSPTLAPGAYVLGLSTAGTAGFIFRGPDGAYAGGTAVINGAQASSGANRDAVFSLTLVSAPEPASIGLMGIAGLGMLVRRRRA